MTTKKSDDNNKEKQADVKTNDHTNGDNSNDSNDSKQASTDDKTIDRTNKEPPFAAISEELKEHYKDLEHYSNQNNDHHPVPSLPPAAHHAPPEDSSELLSPWWSEEPPETISQQTETEPPSQQEPEQQPEQQPDPSNTASTDDDHGHYIINFNRTATGKEGDEKWNEDCMIWTNDPKKILKSMENTVKQHSPFDPVTTRNTPPTANTTCTMVCLFRESLEQKRQKRKALSSWNPLLGNWLVVARNESSVMEHILETQIVKKDSPHYYTIELGERLGRLDEDVMNFMKRTMTPMQALGQRYMESWKDGTQANFFTKFMTSAQRGDGLFLLRDSIRRMVENMTDSDGKNNGGDDHK